MATPNNDFVLAGQEIPHELVGQFHESSLNHPGELRQNLADHEYAFLRGVLEKDEVLAAREEVFSRLIEVDEIKPPAIDGIATGRSHRRELANNLVSFWRSVSEGTALRRVSHGLRVRSIMQTVFAESARPQDYLWLRPRPAGWSTGFHYDYPFFAQGSSRVYTVWVALGNISIQDGPLALLEGSHRYADLIQPIRDQNEAINTSPATAKQAAFEGEWDEDVIAFVRKRRGRFLTTNFFAGDLLIFGMNILHGALDNQSKLGRVRLSCDVRYQPAADTLDARYFGSNPTGAGGDGYGDMNSCKPLTEIT